jgi:ABC-type transport system substrate-binding protein
MPRSAAGVVPRSVGPVTGVTAPDATTVVFTFAEVDTQLLYDLLAQNIVPEHIWKDIKEPETFTNETPGRQWSLHRGDRVQGSSVSA